jgi:hypothetical protein
MMTSKWIGAAVLASLTCAGLACVGLVHSQQAASKPAASPDPAKIVVIEEPGKPKMECLIQKTYGLPNGQTAVEVRVLATGEVMTFIEGNPTRPKGLLGKQQPGMPVEHVQERVVTGPPPMGQSNGKLEPVAAAEEYRTIQEEGKQPQKCRVLARWRDTNGNMNCECQALDTGEKITLVEMGPAQPMSGAAPGSRAVATRI